jgi:hypothetical protein
MSSIQIRAINYRGWKNAVEISNSEIKLIVVPEIGRIMHYSFINEENIFYENENIEGISFISGEYYKENNHIAAPNLGGNRVLPCSEEYFHFISGSRHVSDPFINASAYNFSLLENGIVLQSLVSGLLGIQIKRTITISTNGTTVQLAQELIKIKPAKSEVLENIPLTIWSLSKIKNPNISYLPINKNSVFSEGYLIPFWPDAKNNADINISKNDSLIELKSTENLPQKVGSDSKKWIASYLNNSLFIESFNFEEAKKKTYPDCGTSVTIFGNDLFSELECLSPERTLKIGENIEYDIQWNLHKIIGNNNAKEFLNQL